MCDIKEGNSSSSYGMGSRDEIDSARSDGRHPEVCRGCKDIRGRQPATSSSRQVLQSDDVQQGACGEQRRRAVRSDGVQSVGLAVGRRVAGDGLTRSSLRGG